MINILWFILHLNALIIPSYLTLLNYKKKKTYVNKWVYSLMLVITLLLILAQLNCLRMKEIMCQIVPFMLFHPLILIYMSYLITSRKNNDRHSIIIKCLSLLSILLFALIRTGVI